MKSKKQEEFMDAYRACHKPFLRYCSALAYGRLDTEDLVQDVLLAAWKHYDNIQDKDRFLHYLIRTARNRSISFLRRKKYQTELLDKHANRLRAQEVSPTVLLDIQLLYRKLDELPEKQKNALILFEISGFSMKEIAAIQKTTVGAIKTKISRGRKRLQVLLQEQKRTPSQLLNSLKSICL